MKKSFYSFTIFFLINNCFAFLNIEALRQSQMQEKILGSSKVMLSQQKGNVDKTIINFDTLGRYKNNRHNFLALIDYRYGESFDQIDTRDGHLHFRYSFDLTNVWEVEFFQQTEFNKFQDLNARFLFGAGSRHQLYKVNLLSLYSGLGIFYEKENLENQPNINNPRGNIYLSLLWSRPDSYSISSTLYYQPNIEQLNDNRVRFNIGLETVFENNFTQTIEYSLSRDTRAPDDVKSTDTTLRAGIGYNY